MPIPSRHHCPSHNPSTGTRPHCGLHRPFARRISMPAWPRYPIGSMVGMRKASARSKQLGSALGLLLQRTSTLSITPRGLSGHCSERSSTDLATATLLRAGRRARPPAITQWTTPWCARTMTWRQDDSVVPHVLIRGNRTDEGVVGVAACLSAPGSGI